MDKDRGAKEQVGSYSSSYRPQLIVILSAPSRNVQAQNLELRSLASLLAECKLCVHNLMFLD